MAIMHNEMLLYVTEVTYAMHVVSRFITKSSNSNNTNRYIELEIYSVRKYIFYRPEVVLIFGLDVSFVSDPYLLLILLSYGTRGLLTAQSYQRC